MPIESRPLSIVMLIERFDRAVLTDGSFSRKHCVSALTMLGKHEQEPFLRHDSIFSLSDAAVAATALILSLPDSIEPTGRSNRGLVQPQHSTRCRFISF